MENEKQNLAIIYISVAGEVACAICGSEGRAEVGFEICLANPKQLAIEPDVPRQIVCQNCAEQHDPVLAEQFGHLMFLKRHKERVDRMLPWLSQTLDTVGVLGTVLKFNEKKDIAYTGELLAGAAEKMQKELKGFGPWTGAYVPDELPF